MYSDMDVYMAHGTHQTSTVTSDMQILFTPWHHILYLRDEEKCVGCFKEESLPNRLSDRCFSRSPARRNSLDARCVLYRVRSITSQPQLCNQWQVWLAVWSSVISLSLDLWRSTCGRRRFKQAVTSWLWIVDTDFFLLSPDNGKFPRSLLPYIIPLMYLRNLHPGSHGYQFFFSVRQALR